MTDPDPLGIVGQLIADKYRIERMVGEGGFAVVYRAEHVVWQRPVAVKLFNLDFARPRSRLTGASRFTVRAA